MLHSPAHSTCMHSQRPLGYDQEASKAAELHLPASIAFGRAGRRCNRTLHALEGGAACSSSGRMAVDPGSINADTAQQASKTSSAAERTSEAAGQARCPAAAGAVARRLPPWSFASQTRQWRPAAAAVAAAAAGDPGGRRELRALLSKGTRHADSHRQIRRQHPPPPPLPRTWASSRNVGKLRSRSRVRSA